MKKVILFVGMMAFLVSNAMSQETVQAKKYENVSWHQIVLVNFKPGKVDRAKEIIGQYLEAGKAANLKGPEMYWMETGPYDLMLIWTMDGGPSDLEWQRSPDNVKWRSEMIKKLGSEDAVKKLSDEYSSLVSNSTNYLSRKDL